MYYDVKTDKNGIFSVLIHTYTMRDHDANGVNYVKASHLTPQQVDNCPCTILVVLIKKN